MSEKDGRLLEVRDLQVSFHTYRGVVQAVRGISLEVRQGEAVGIVGESGCGKSVSMHAMLGLLPRETAFATGSVELLGRQLLNAGDSRLQEVRGNIVSMIFQDPMTSLNPVLTIGTQLTEGLQLHRGMNREEAEARALELLGLVGIPAPEKRMKEYPHQFSGGMRQRVMIAMALVCSPRLLVADEPTTALDVTIQAQILDLLARLKQELGLSVVLISHDLGVVAELCDRVLVMYAGKIIEGGRTEEILASPLHPYTQGLLRSLPRLDLERGKELETIEGRPPDLLYPITGCAFAPRCPYAMGVCVTEEPPESAVGSQRVSCWLQQKKAAEEGRG